VYICTTAEREYAWEAWRLLDPEAALFPHAELAWRMLCVSSPQKKDLLNVLRKQDIDNVAALGHMPQCASDLHYVTDKGVCGCRSTLHACVTTHPLGLALQCAACSLRALQPACLTHVWCCCLPSCRCACCRCSA
jgi:hypothetical protein